MFMFMKSLLPATGRPWLFALLLLLTPGPAFAADIEAPKPVSSATNPVAAPRPSATLQTDVEYGRAGDVSLKLDACIPPGPGPVPAVILVHGGGFTAGSKEKYVTPMFKPLSAAGFAWFSINYRLAPQYAYPAAIEDVDQAIVFVKAHAAEFKVNPDRIALLGESAGGHLVSYVGTQTDPRWRVAAVVSFYGPHNLMGEYEMRQKQGQPPSAIQAFLSITNFDTAAFARIEAASAFTHVRPGMPPYLLVHGDNDQTVAYDQSVKMRERMLQAGNVCELYTIPGGGHGMSSWEKIMPAYKDQVVAWLGRLKQPPAR